MRTAATLPTPSLRARVAAVLSLVLAGLVLAPAAAQAATNTFLGASSQDWNTASNWSQGSVPDPTDDVAIPLNRHAVLDGGADSSINSIDLDGTAVVQGTRTLTVGTGTSSIDNNLTIRDQGSKLRLNGTTNHNAGQVSAGSTGSTATAGGIVENAGTLSITGDVIIADGFGGQGLRNLPSATINRTSSAGTATIQLPLDNDGAVNATTGTLRITNGSPSGQQSGGSFTAAASSTLSFGGGGFVPAHSVGATGSVGGAGTVRLEVGGLALAAAATYDPATTAMRSGTLFLPGTGTTTTLDADSTQGCCASIEGGGTLSVGNGSSRLDTVAIQGGSDVLFSSGATIAATGNVAVRDPGTTLRLNGTTTLSSGSWSVGGQGATPNPGGRVENAGTLNITGDVLIGGNVNGELANLSGATITRTTSAGTAQVQTPTTTNAGTIDIATGTLSFTGSSPSLDQTGGLTQVASGATLGLSNGMVLSGGTLGGFGTVAGSVSNTGGTVAPGTSPGILRITGDYTQGSGGTLLVEVNGSTPGTQFDQLDVGGVASLDGTLDIDNGAGHDPPPGASFGVVRSATRTGSFASVTGEQISPGKSYDVTYASDGASLVVQGAAPTPDLTIDDRTVTEGNSGTTTVTFTVTRSSTAAGDASVDYSTANGTATAGSDYVAESGTVTFRGASTKEFVTVAVNGDALDEADERFVVNLSNAVNANITDGQGEGTITDDDPPPVISVTDAGPVNEGDSGTTNVEFKVSLSAASGRQVRVDFFTTDDSAQAPSDYTARSGALTFAPGETEKTVLVAVKGDTADESDETFFLNVDNPQNATEGDGNGRATIVDDDLTPPPPPPSLSIGNVSLDEGDSGTREARLAVSLSRASQSEVSVDFATRDGSAREPSDYAKRGGTLTFAPGQTRKSIRVPVKGDTRVEPDEAFSVALSGPEGARIADGRGRATIRNDDEPPPTPPSGAPRCDGRTATHVGDFSAEVIVGTPGPDVIVARGGADVIHARGGDDRVCGGAGADEVRGAEGADRLFGEDGADRLDGGEGADRISGGAGADWLWGRAGADRLFGGAHEDRLRGGAGTDACDGGPDADSVAECES
jgi:Ca2+-binding RTX toxin-like protein